MLCPFSVGRKVSEVLVTLTTLDVLMVEKCLQVKLSGMDPEGFSRRIFLSWSLQVQEPWCRREGCSVALDYPGEMPLRPPFCDGVHPRVCHQSF